MTNENKTPDRSPSPQKRKEEGPTAKAVGTLVPSLGTFVVIDGTVYPSLGDFRADNTFTEVKRGFCPEGVTLVAIDKPH